MQPGKNWRTILNLRERSPWLGWHLSRGPSWVNHPPRKRRMGPTLHGSTSRHQVFAGSIRSAHPTSTSLK